METKYVYWANNFGMIAPYVVLEEHTEYYTVVSKGNENTVHLPKVGRDHGVFKTHADALDYLIDVFTTEYNSQSKKLAQIKEKLDDLLKEKASPLQIA